MGYAAFIALVSNALMSTADPFVVAVIPDTQLLVETHSDGFNCATQWIADQASLQNIQFVVHLGDVTENGNDASAGMTQIQAEWDRADASFSLLEAAPAPHLPYGTPGIPYGVVPGNHDMESTQPRQTSEYNARFPPSRHSARPWFGGSMANVPAQSELTNDNNRFYRFNASGADFLLVGLEFAPRAAALSWADSVIANEVAISPGTRVLIFTHGYLCEDGTHSTSANNACKLDWWFAPGGFTNGDGMWTSFVRNHPNIIMVLGGHFGGGVGPQFPTDPLDDARGAHRTSIGAQGNTLHEVFVNHQGTCNTAAFPGQCDCYVQTLRFVPSQGIIEARTVEISHADPSVFSTLTGPVHVYDLVHSMSDLSNLCDGGPDGSNQDGRGDGGQGLDGAGAADATAGDRPGGDSRQNETHPGEVLTISGDSHAGAPATATPAGCHCHTLPSPPLLLLAALALARILRRRAPALRPRLR